MNYLRQQNGILQSKWIWLRSLATNNWHSRPDERSNTFVAIGIAAAAAVAKLARHLDSLQDEGTSC